MFRLGSRTVFQSPKCQSRSLWEWVNMMFNKPDPDRLREVGPNKACAEWILKNGGAIKWCGESELVSSYHDLPRNARDHSIEVIDGSNSSISHYGLGHLTGCKQVSRIIFHNCEYVDDRAMVALEFVDSPLKYLQVSKCLNITDDGLKSIPHLKDLQHLVLFGLASVNDMPDCEVHLKKRFPNCKIETTDQST